MTEDSQVGWARLCAHAVREGDFRMGTKNVPTRAIKKLFNRKGRKGREVKQQVTDYGGIAQQVEMGNPISMFPLRSFASFAVNGRF